MFDPAKTSVVERRRFITGAVGIATAGMLGVRSGEAQTVAPTAIPIPTRIQTPDLAFADPLLQLRNAWAEAKGADDVILSIVPAEPASDQLLTDARSGTQRFSGAIVPNWLIPDLVRDAFITPLTAPPEPLPASITQLRSFGGQWVAADLDHDCDLLFYRQDLLDHANLTPAETWDDLLQQCTTRSTERIGSIALPVTHAQQVVDHYVSMAAPYVLAGTAPAKFWFDEESMEPVIDSGAHRQALETWLALSQTTPEILRGGSTGDLWQALLDGSVAYLVASADFLPFALDQGIDPGVLGIARLPGVRTDDGTVARAGNVTGASWGGVVMSSASEQASGESADLLRTFAQTGSQQALWTNQASGIIPAPVTTTDIESFSAQLASAGWDAAISTRWLQALQATFGDPVQLAPLRIAETRRYLDALERRIVALLSGVGSSAAEALDLAAQDWRAINNEIDIEVQRALFAQSLMPPPHEQQS